MSALTLERRYAQALDRLKQAGLRPTRQRLGLARNLFEGEDRHVTAEALHQEAMDAGLRVSLATIYNTLHQFTDVGLLREVVVGAGRSYFDTNVSQHHHFFFEDSADLEDIPADEVTISRLPEPPQGRRVERVEVIVRLSPEKKSTY